MNPKNVIFSSLHLRFTHKVSKDCELWIAGFFAQLIKFGMNVWALVPYSFSRRFYLTNLSQHLIFLLDDNDEESVIFQQHKFRQSSVKKNIRQI